MTNRQDGRLRLLIADPDGARRGRILARAGTRLAIEAASLSEAFDLAESQRPDAIALAAEVTGEAGLDMFLHLVDALSIALVVYGDRARDQTPPRLRKSIPFVAFGPTDHPERILDAFLGLPDDAARGPAGSAPAIGGPPGLGPTARDARVATGLPAGTSRGTPSLIVLGASTGGVTALETVLTAFPADCPPTLVVQHIRAGFVEGMIRRMDARCRPRVLPAEDGLRLQPGHVYIAQDPERHLVVAPGDPARCRLKADVPRHGHRPSVDALFESVAGRHGVAAALLTGMGADGAEGMTRIRTGGGLTIAQNAESCVVYGMPRVAVERGAADMVLPLERIAAALLAGMPQDGRAARAPRNAAT